MEDEETHGSILSLLNATRSSAVRDERMVRGATRIRLHLIKIPCRDAQGKGQPHSLQVRPLLGYTLAR
jgi:hypothetical protein